MQHCVVLAVESLCCAVVVLGSTSHCGGVLQLKWIPANLIQGLTLCCALNSWHLGKGEIGNGGKFYPDAGQYSMDSTYYYLTIIY